MTGTPRTVALAALLLVVTGSPPARAGEPWSSNHGFEIAFRTGVSLRAGDIAPAGESVDPWMSFGIGYEWSSQETLQGWETSRDSASEWTSR